MPDVDKVKSVVMFSLLINAVILLLNCLVLILHLYMHYLSLRHNFGYLSAPERALICFRLSFLAAALWSPLNISLIIRRFQTIFGSYIP